MNVSTKTLESASPQALGNPVVKRELFSGAECQQLRTLPLSWEEARLSGETADVSAQPSVKVASRQLIPLSDDFRWVYERLGGFVKNTKALGFDIEKIHAPLKVQRYEAGGYHCWHSDIANPRYRNRKLGITVQLSASDSYSGGDFQLFDYPEPVSIPRDPGCAVIYPAFMVHRVATVESGSRYSLTAWVIGPPLR